MLSFYIKTVGIAFQKEFSASKQIFCGGDTLL